MTAGDRGGIGRGSIAAPCWNLAAMLLVTARFRDNARRPESMLAGIAYQNWFSPDSDNVRFAYIAESAEGPLFANTGLRAGDAIADVVGYEWDNRDPARDGRRLWDPARSHNAA